MVALPSRAVPGVSAPLRRRVLALGLAVTLLGIASTSGAMADPTPPSEEDVQAARAAENLAAMDVAQVEVQLAALNATLDDTWVAAQLAGEEYLIAQTEVEAAAADATAAQSQLDGALSQMEVSRKTLAGIAIEQYRSGGAMQGLQALLSADGLAEVVERSNALEIVNGVADNAVQQYRADSLVAATMQQRADQALSAKQQAAERADAALERANTQQQAAQAAVAAAEEQRSALIGRLAEARGTTAALERERQDAIDAERRQAAERAAERERAAREQADREQAERERAEREEAEQEPEEPTREPTREPEPPTPTREPVTEPTREPVTEPTREPVTEPTREPAPEPSPTPTPPPAPPVVPTPPPTTPPVSSTPGLGSGTSVGSAAQGRGAVAWARKQIGADYVWGSTGPTAFDCSGLTSMAWASQGVGITRTSRSQYTHVKKISYGSLRPGDLLFYATNTSNPSTIYHVAIYAGNGQMIEAPVPGKKVNIVPMRYSQSMPYAGRP